ncbi:MAG: carboxypeptidase regulatory-like domain-containing protein [Nitrososphaerales archaeon]
MKQTKRMTLLSVRNNSESPLYSVEVKNPDGAIKFAKAKGWNSKELDSSTAKISANDRPINRGGNLILLILTDNFSSSLQWSVADSIGKVLGSGTVKERAKQPTNKPVTEVGTEEVVKSQPDTNDNALMLKVVDGNSKRPVEGATVIIIDSSGKVLAGKTTDSNGEIKLIVSSGIYKVTIQANSYNKLVETLQIHGDTQKTFELTRTSSVTIRTTAITN